eukprot:TRINITY_DN61998_c0_g1_i1.p1 TRINITY_DN61998_c0_g1~~TRINITY_DN61998_c0_g1_i1.p1  ORF type:complete len:1142 (-),score=113.13 TRINITY_DN61998_c0_g1_i1:166-3591(-)
MVPAIQHILHVFHLSKWVLGFWPLADASTGRRQCFEDALKSRSLPLENSSLGLWVSDWESSWLANYISKIILEEKLGYETVMSGLGSSSIEGIYAVAGCANPQNYRLPNVSAESGLACSPTPRQVHHVALEVWGLDKLEQVEDSLSQWREVIPDYIGDMGYVGIDGAHVLGPQMLQAYVHNATVLEHYRSYNASMFQLSTYFDAYSAINLSMLRLCEKTRLMQQTEILRYLAITNDTGGVTSDPVHGLVGRCWNHSWWLSRACRDADQRCIPVITAGDGWGMHDFMQQADAYNMPFAVAVARSSREWVLLGHTHNVLIYWWQPEYSFLDLNPSLITMPVHDSEERKSGILLSSNANVPLLKVVYNGLATQAPNVHRFLSQMSISKASMDELLQLALNNECTLSNTSCFEDVACHWLKEHTDAWKSWLLVNCPAAQGQIDNRGQFLIGPSEPLEQTQVSGCAFCEPGFYSYSHPNYSSHFCKQCPMGRSSQESGSLLCTLCEPGRFAGPSFVQSNSGGACAACPEGSFSAALGSTNCELCPAGDFQADAGHSSCAGCPLGYYSDPGAVECIPTLSLAHSNRLAAVYFLYSITLMTLVSVCSALCPYRIPVHNVHHKALGKKSKDNRGGGRVKVTTSEHWLISSLTVKRSRQQAPPDVKKTPSTSTLPASPVLGQRRVTRFASMIQETVADAQETVSHATDLHLCAPVTFAGTGISAMDGVKFLARAVDANTVELLDIVGQPIRSDFHTSKGEMVVTFPHSMLYKGLFGRKRLSYLVIMPGLVGLAAFLILDASPSLEPNMVVHTQSEAVHVIIQLTLVSVAACFFGYLHYLYALRKKLRTPLSKRLDRYESKIRRRNPDPKPCPRGPSRSIDILDLDDLFAYFADYVLERNMHYVVGNLLRPLTHKCRLSYAELVGPKEVSWFVSHCWGTPFRHFMTSLKKHSEKTGKAESYWICSFSMNQWTLEEELGSGGVKDTSFHLCLQSHSCVGTATVIDASATNFQRSWCLYELLQTMLLQKDNADYSLMLCTESGVLSSGNASAEVTMNVADRVAHLRLQNAEATVQADKEMIDRAVAEMPGGFAEVNHFLRTNILQAVKGMKQIVVADIEQAIDTLEDALSLDDRDRKFYRRSVSSSASYYVEL